VSLETLCQGIIKGLQKVAEPEEAEEEILRVMAEEQNWVQNTENQSMQEEMQKDHLHFEDQADLSDEPAFTVAD